MIEKLKVLVLKMNSWGIPFPYARHKDAPSLVASLVIMSFAVVTICIFGWVKGADTQNALYLFVACLSGFLGQKFSNKFIGSETQKIEGDIK